MGGVALHLHGTPNTTHPFLIFDVDIRYLVTEEFHYVSVAFVSCTMQGSPLVERKNIFRIFL